MREAPDILDSDSDENYIYQVDNMCLEDSKEKLELRKYAFEWEKN